MKPIENVTYYRDAEVCGIETCRVFRSSHAFRTQRRIERAKSLLKKGLPFVQTALGVGFSDQSHFSNTFRRLTGATPKQYLSWNHHNL